MAARGAYLVAIAGVFVPSRVRGPGRRRKWSAARRRSTIRAPPTSRSISSATRPSSTGTCSISASARRRRSSSRTPIRSRSTASSAGWARAKILGSLDANGKVIVVNKDGIIFGAGAVINTAGFLATTSDIRNEDFMAGRFNFHIPAGPTPRSSTWARSRRRAAASPRWSRRACATPAPSRRTSAR